MNQTAFFSKDALNSTGNQTLPICQSIGQGSIKTIYCNSGIQVVVSDFALYEPTNVKIDNSKSCYGFGFCLSGCIEAQLPCFTDAFIIQKGQSGFFNFPELETYSTNIHSERIIRVNIYISQDNLLKFAGKDPGQLPAVLTDNRQVPCRAVDTITPSMHAVLHQVFNCTYQGLTRQLYVEGKVLELIAHKIAQMNTQRQHPKHKKKLSSDEIERVRHAANLLCFDLEHPPNIAELSGHAGMCRSKLYICFHEVFGTSPFGYLQQKRMEMAERLLRDGEINVTQAAYTVGYSSLSHFTKAFTKHFGVPPSKYPQIFSPS
jgi:AraC-like DNA-binding protein